MNKKNKKELKKTEKQQEAELLKKLTIIRTSDLLKKFQNKIITTPTDLSEKLRKQADKKNEIDCKAILDELEEASNNGEYVKTIQLKTNQAHYFKTLGLSVEQPDEKKFGFYEISWKEKELSHVRPTTIGQAAR